jgi:hypothetical protein
MGFDITWEASGFLDVDKIIELGLFYQSKGIDIKADVLDSQWSGQFFRMFRASRIAGKIELKRYFVSLDQVDKTCVHLTRSEISTLTRVTKENAHLLAMVCFDEVLENFFYKTIDKTSNPLDTKTSSLS